MFMKFLLIHYTSQSRALQTADLSLSISPSFLLLKLDRDALFLFLHNTYKDIRQDRPQDRLSEELHF